MPLNSEELKEQVSYFAELYDIPLEYQNGSIGVVKTVRVPVSSGMSTYVEVFDPIGPFRERTSFQVIMSKLVKYWDNTIFERRMRSREKLDEERKKDIDKVFEAELEENFRKGVIK